MIIHWALPTIPLPQRLDVVLVARCWMPRGVVVVCCKRKVRWSIVIIINSTISNLNDYNFLNTTQYTFDPIRLLIHCNGAVILLQTADQWTRMVGGPAYSDIVRNVSNELT